MPNRWLVVSLLATATLALGGCQANQLKDENARLTAQNRELRQRAALLEDELAGRADPGAVARLQAELAERDRRLAELASQPAAPAPAGRQIGGIEASYDPQAGTLTASLSGDVLFDSGSATLKQSARATLNRVASSLQGEYAGRPVRVQGHTDSDPIRKTRDKWSDNLDLSLNRSAAVTRYLIERGVAASRITTSGYGEHQPRGRDKSRNRRVEIVVVVN